MPSLDQPSIDDVVPEGFELVQLRDGFSEVFGAVYQNRATRILAFRVAPHHVNPDGVCHGGALATFADMQILGVRPEATGQVFHFPTIQISINYLAQAQLHSWVEATVTLVKMTRRMTFTQALITADGETVASATGIYRNAGPAVDRAGKY